MTGLVSDLMVIGLDGVPHWLLRQLADAGVMPATAKLLPQAALRPLVAPIPDISSTSWASFLTGADSGRHGIYGFIDMLPGTYDTFFPNLRDLKAVPVWQPVSAAGGRSLVLNVPGTYPAPSMQGTCVSGFVAPDFDRAIWPAEHIAPLRRLGYQLDVEVGDVRADVDAFLDRVDDALAARRRAYHYLLSAEPDARLAVCVVTETDRLHHFLWRDLMDDGSPYHDRILAFYERVDEAIADLVERAGDGGLMLVSDHGFGPVTTQFYLNAWLRETGYLRLAHDARSLSEIDEATAAFALDPGRVFLNRRGRFPRGRDLAATDLIDEISSGLRALRRTPDGAITSSGQGEPVIAEVLRGAELYTGPCAAAAPDLVVMPAPGVQIRGAWTSPAMVVDGPLTGTHTREDALLWCRGDFSEEPADMRDVAPTMLGVLGIPQPSTMDGRNMRGHRNPPQNQEEVR